MESTAEVSGPVPIAEAWERCAVPARWTEWALQITEVEADTERIAPGTTGRLHAPGGVRLDFTVTEVDEPAGTFRWEIRWGVLKIELEQGVRAAEQGTTAWLRATGPRLLLMPYGPFARGALEKLVA